MPRFATLLATQLSLAFDHVARARNAGATTMFASGSNAPGEIRGFAALGISIGVSVSELTEAAIDELERLAGVPHVAVFSDTGCFGEVAFDPTLNQLVVREPISHEEWQRRLAIMHRLAVALGAQLSVVAPDRVGCQRTTMERLRRYAQETRALDALGATVLLPLQSGDLDRIAFFRAARDVLGVDIVPAFPLKKAACTPQEVLRTMDGLRVDGVTRLHLLGLGLENRKAPALLAALATRNLVATCDACLITAHVGRTNGPSGGPRALTAAQDAVRDEAGEAVWRETRHVAWNVALDYTDSILADVNTWLAPSERRALAAAAALTKPLARLMLRDPERALAVDLGGCAVGEHPVVAWELDQAWRRFVEQMTTQPRKEAGIRRAFADHAARRRVGRDDPQPFTRALEAS